MSLSIDGWRENLVRTTEYFFDCSALIQGESKLYNYVKAMIDLAEHSGVIGARMHGWHVYRRRRDAMPRYVIRGD